MRLSCRFLKDVASVNSYEMATQAEWTEGDTVDMYFVLVDEALDLPSQGFNPSGRRYIPNAGATLSCMVENIDDAKKVTRLAIQPFAQDGSIWKLQILPTDPIRGTPQFRITLSEGVKVTRGLVKCGIKVYPQGNF